MDGTDGPVASTSSRTSGPRNARIQFSDQPNDSQHDTGLPKARVKRRTTMPPSASAPLPRKSAATELHPANNPPHPRRRKASNSLANANPATQNRKGPFLYNDQDSGFDSPPSSTINAFSDEYDLAHEDPQILQDVQRALKLKARREARMKLETQTQYSQASSTNWSSISNPFPTAQPATVTSASASSTFPRLSQTSSDIDFSPSTSAAFRLGLHPVPTSIDDGLTIDWSVNADEDRMDRRWTMSMSKKKGKERAPPISATALDAQENRYKARLSRIKTIASPQTMRKRAIIADQLERQYKVIYGSVTGGEPAEYNWNLLTVSRWWGSQPSIVRTTLDKAEPFTWLRHLDQRAPKVVAKGQARSHWHLNALVMEEYISAQRVHGFTTIIQNPTPSPQPTSPHFSPSPSNYPSSSVLPIHGTGLFHVSSHSSSQSALGPSLTRYRSNEGRISFEPLIESSAMDSVSRKSAESSYSGSHPGAGAVYPLQPPIMLSSPASSRLNIHSKMYRDRSNDSDDASAPNSISGHSYEDGGHTRKTFSLNMDVLERTSLSAKDGPRSLVGESLSTPPSPSRPMNLKTMSLDGVSSNMFSRVKPSPVHSRRSSTTNVNRVERTKGRPPALNLEPNQAELDRKRQEHEEQENLHREYEHKSRLLREASNQNSRIRQLLNRLAADAREYDLMQNSLSALLDVPIPGLPAELLEAFSHDPCAVTGATRRLEGWRAVEDIHARIIRQRTIFDNFLSLQHNPNASLVDDNIAKEPVASLHETLEQLRSLKVEILEKAHRVACKLSSVQVLHREVKSEYNDALAHTSIVYPEISRITALDESYKDSYQHFWEMGMDAVTFLLDSFTPFWRTYGKTIGEDVQDFLIIPLYRNEFTGQTKRYLIESLPKRSIKHWFFLVAFFYGTLGVVVLQSRAAVTSSMNISLSWIPYDWLRIISFPFFTVGIVAQWVAVIVELLILLTQFGVLIWWIGWTIKLFN